MTISTTALFTALLAVGVHAQSAPYANMPSVFPPIDQQQYMSGPLLDAPLIVEGMKKVRAVVPQRLLELPTSIQRVFSDVTYPGGPAAAAANCYWPAGTHCVRTVAADGYQPDITNCPNPNDWGVTYDDGPTVLEIGPDTSDVVANLNTLGVKATFFVAGTAASANPAELKATYEAGHEIAVHTWTHRPLTNLTNEQIVAEILYTEAKIYQIIGVVPKLFRPPYGDCDDRVRAIIGALGYTNVIWTSAPDRDTHDTTVSDDVGRAGIVNTVKATWLGAQPGFISLNHDISNSTSAIAVNVLKEIQKMGPAFPLKMKTVGACLGVPSYVGVPVGTTPAAPASPSYRATPSQSDNPSSSSTVSASLAMVMGLIAAASLALF
ncbi:hypothetical protein DFJ77DRAFT_457424 [Powellomyces hirtus]|nr:hypothetical protein DFJ77DRAFT_457424 [Powellomyces hirtus]